MIAYLLCSRRHLPVISSMNTDSINIQNIIKPRDHNYTDLILKLVSY